MTATPTTHRTLTHAEFLAEASERFGKDPADWAFLCPRCGDTATGADFRAALEERPREHQGKPVGPFDVLGQECIGRSLGALEGTATRGCNWVAYGLFPAPWEVVMPDGHSTHSFPLAA